LLKEIVVDDWIVVQVAIASVNIWEYFTLAKLDEESGQSINPDVGVWDILMTMWATPGLFKSFNNFNLREFEELTQLMVPTIISHARSTWEPHYTLG